MDLQDLSVGLLQVPNKQWGTNTIGSRTTRTEAYPLPYSEFCLPIVSGKGYVGGLNYGFGVGVTNFGLTSVTIANNSEDSSYRWTGYTYIVVGAQPQWGNLWAGYTEVLNWYFPLTTSQVYAVCLTKHTKNISSGHNWEPARIEEWNNSYARIHPDGDLGYSVIAICKAQQQWGTSVSPIIFSISFSNTMYTILQMPQSASTSAFRAEVWALERKDQDSCAFFTGSGNYSRHWIAVGF